LVAALLEIIQIQQEQIQGLRDEIARLKGEKPRPKIKPSVVEKGPGNKDKTEHNAKRPGPAKRKKTDELEVHETLVVKADNVPPGSAFKGYEEFTVQGLLVQPHNTLYLRERWITPQGMPITAAPEAARRPDYTPIQISKKMARRTENPGSKTAAQILRLTKNFA
jgi:hypothetical protein